MENFDIALQIISDINQKYNIARSDLEQTIGRLENSLKKIIPELKFHLSIAKDNHTGTIFSLILDPNPSDNRINQVKISDFFITTNGYPIAHGRYSKITEEYRSEGSFESANDIENHFKNLIESSDSIIIQSVGFAARRKSLS